MAAECMDPGLQIDTAENGREALDRIKAMEYDIVVSDLAMPEMSGLELLEEVVKKCPHTARIIVSGYADRLKMAECLKVGHRYVSKPFQLSGLVELLERIGAYSALIPSLEVRRVLGGAGAIPSPPALYLQVTKALEDPNTTIEDIAALIQGDAGMSIRLLQIVNSAHFGLNQEVGSPGEAIQYLGVETVRALVIGLSFFTFSESAPGTREKINAIWQHSLAVATSARGAARAEGRPTALCNSAFLAGIVHDLGTVLLGTHAADLYSSAQALSEAERCPMLEAERKTFGCTHAEVSAYAMALWGFATPAIEAVLHYARPSHQPPGEFTAATALHIAHAVETDDPAVLDADYLNQVGACADYQEWQKRLRSGA